MKTITMEEYEFKLLLDLLENHRKDLSDMRCDDLYVEDLPLTKTEYKKFSKKFNELFKNDNPSDHTYLIEGEGCKIVSPEVVGNSSIPYYFEMKFKKLFNKKKE